MYIQALVAFPWNAPVPHQDQAQRTTAVRTKGATPFKNRLASVTRRHIMQFTALTHIRHARCLCW